MLMNQLEDPENGDSTSNPDGPLGAVQHNATAITAQSRLGYSVGEFARMFDRHRSWVYRLLYAGLIQKFDLPGRIIIPASEVTRLSGQLTTHGGAR
ncbi:MAG: helix-turn-helix domain-containing protein [Verrucomicrobiae bacterium]|nr:helix-turn-helix domain-containing protein [Verrucomicrobiae bacterium]